MVSYKAWGNFAVMIVVQGGYWNVDDDVTTFLREALTVKVGVCFVCDVSTRAEVDELYFCLEHRSDLGLGDAPWGLDSRG